MKTRASVLCPTTVSSTRLRRHLPRQRRLLLIPIDLCIYLLVTRTSPTPPRRRPCPRVGGSTSNSINLRKSLLGRRRRDDSAWLPRNRPSDPPFPSKSSSLSTRRKIWRRPFFRISTTISTRTAFPFGWRNIDTRKIWESCFSRKHSSTACFSVSSPCGVTPSASSVSLDGREELKYRDFGFGRGKNFCSKPIHNGRWDEERGTLTDEILNTLGSTHFRLVCNFLFHLVSYCFIYLLGGLRQLRMVSSLNRGTQNERNCQRFLPPQRRQYEIPTLSCRDSYGGYDIVLG